MSSSNATTATETEERPALLDRQSYLELDARGRAHSLLDVGTGRESCAVRSTASSHRGSNRRVSSLKPMTAWWSSRECSRASRAW